MKVNSHVMRDFYHLSSEPTSPCYNRKKSEILTSQQFVSQFGVFETTVIIWHKKFITHGCRCDDRKQWLYFT